MKRVTIKDIAKHLSVSVSTVSRALVDDKTIRKETKELVLKAAQELGYRPNPVATNLRYGRTNTIGVIVPEMVTPFASTVIKGIQSVLYPLGFKVVIADSQENSFRELENLTMLEGFMVDGLIIGLCNYTENKSQYLRLQKMGMPMVFYDRIPHGLDVSQVLVDDYNKAFLLVEHLIRKGCKKIIYIKGPDYVYNSVERYRGYRDALLKFNISLNADSVQETGLEIENGCLVVDSLIERNVAFDAIFAFTDTLAIGAMNRLRELGYSVPSDVAIASFSGSILSSIVYPKLTTVEPHLELMGEVAAQLLLDKLNSRSEDNKTIFVEAELRLRESSDR